MGPEEESDYTLNQIHNFMSVQPYVKPNGISFIDINDSYSICIKSFKKLKLVISPTVIIPWTWREYNWVSYDNALKSLYPS